MVKGRTIIVAAGDFPNAGGRAWLLLEQAERVVCCDSAADEYRLNFHRCPDVIVGDMDSLADCELETGRCTVVKIAEQETNDLTKAINYCRGQGWNNLAIVGATGRREDHALGNVFRALESQVEVVTNEGTFYPVCGEAAFEVAKGTAVSVFVTDPTIRMTSKGLEWPLDGVCFANLYCGTLNRACESGFSVTSTGPVFVYVAEI